METCTCCSDGLTGSCTSQRTAEALTKVAMSLAPPSKPQSTPASVGAKLRPSMRMEVRELPAERAVYDGLSCVSVGGLAASYRVSGAELLERAGGGSVAAASRASVAAARAAWRAASVDGASEDHRWTRTVPVSRGEAGETHLTCFMLTCVAAVTAGAPEALDEAPPSAWMAACGMKTHAMARARRKLAPSSVRSVPPSRSAAGGRTAATDGTASSSTKEKLRDGEESVAWSRVSVRLVASAAAAAGARHCSVVGPVIVAGVRPTCSNTQASLGDGARLEPRTVSREPPPRPAYRGVTAVAVGASDES